MSVTAEKARHRTIRVRQGAWRVAVLGTALTLVALTPPATAGASSTASAASTTSGPHGIAWTTQSVAPGVQVRTGVLQDADAAGVWTVTVQAPAVNRPTGAAAWAPLGDRTWADATAGRLRDAGFEPRLERVAWDDYADTPHGTIAAGILDTVPYREPGSRTRHEYRLTRKGWDLWPAMIALKQWGDRYTADPEGPPLEVLHRDCGAPVEAVVVCTAGDGPLLPRQAATRPGAAARAAT